MSQVLMEEDVLPVRQEEHPPACEGPRHGAGLAGHDAGEPASFLIGTNCSHDWLSCASWVSRVSKVGAYICEDGGKLHTARITAIIPLDFK